MNCPKIIERFIIHAKKAEFVVEHNFIMAEYFIWQIGLLVLKRRPHVH